MPKVVDHAARKQAIMEAVCSLAASSRSLDGVSFRAVAGEMGSSTSTVTHYFGSRDAMLQATYDVLQQGFRDEMDQAEQLPPANGLLAVLKGSLPGFDPYYLAYMAFAMAPEFMQSSAVDLERMKALVTRQIGELLPDRDGAASLALAVLAMADGIALGAYLEPNSWPVEQQERVLLAGLAGLGLTSGDKN